MQREVAVAKLLESRAALESRGVRHLRLFGSTARGEGTLSSDVDLIADFDESRRWTIVSIGSIQMQLTDILGVDVDLTLEAWMKKPVADKALNEAIHVF
jgi:predicted nucleotidyltransferase